MGTKAHDGKTISSFLGIRFVTRHVPRCTPRIVLRLFLNDRLRRRDMPLGMPGKIDCRRRPGWLREIHTSPSFAALAGDRRLPCLFHRVEFVSARKKRHQARAKKITAHPNTFSIIHATDFADRCRRQILPMLHAGYIVWRTAISTAAFARDAVRGVDREWGAQSLSLAIKPDLTFFFNVLWKWPWDAPWCGGPSCKYYESRYGIWASTVIFTNPSASSRAMSTRNI